MNIEDLKTRAVAAQAAIDAIRAEVASALDAYATYIHYALEVQQSSIEFDDDGVNFIAGGNARGWFEEKCFVKYDYFTDPKGYITREKVAKAQAKEDEETKVVRDREAEERRTLERLQAKYPTKS